MKVIKKPKVYRLLEPAIEQLAQMRDIMKTNIPINEREGHKSQAKLERSNLESYTAAIKTLSQQ